MQNRSTLFRVASTLSQIVWGLAFLLGAATAMGAESKYDAEVVKWKSHEEVAQWLKSNFVFDKSRQAQVLSQLKETGPDKVLTRKPETLFEKHYGYCRVCQAHFEQNQS